MKSSAGQQSNLPADLLGNSLHPQAAEPPLHTVLRREASEGDQAPSQKTPGMLRSAMPSHTACGACMLQTCALQELPSPKQSWSTGLGVMLRILECSVGQDVGAVRGQADFTTHSGACPPGR